MPDSTLANLQERISEMHGLRHEVRSRLHRAGDQELAMWGELEPESMAIESSIGQRGGAGREDLERVIARLAQLRTSMS